MIENFRAGGTTQKHLADDDTVCCSDVEIDSWFNILRWVLWSAMTTASSTGRIVAPEATQPEAESD